jgi:cytochrome c1
MKKFAISLMLILAPALALASGDGPQLLDIKADHSNKESLQNGAKMFVNYCMGCHSLKYMRFERVATDLGIPPELMQQHLNFAGQPIGDIYTSRKIGELMTIAADEKAQKRWFGATPPDLTLATRARGGPDWMFTYLTSFYKDDSRPYGVNNKVFKDVGMPHVLVDLQGVQECDVHVDEHNARHVGKCKITKPGSMTPEEYEIAVYDLVNFLDYAAEPYKAARTALGLKVLAFVLLFLFVAVLLNKEYWKDIH